MRAYRIVEKGKRFYVQYRFLWFFWDGDDTSDPKGGYATNAEARQFISRCQKSDYDKWFHSLLPSKVVFTTSEEYAFEHRPNPSTKTEVRK